jgi:menaquinone-dependent protoporphyrinogen oxidase
MMSNRILVAYASRAGSTQEVAEAVAKALREQGQEVDVRAVREVRSLEPYAAVVVGSAAHIMRIYADAVSFVKQHRAALQNMPTAFFVSCMTMKEDNEKNRETVSGYLKPLTALVSPAAVGLFAGKMDASKVGGLMGAMMKKAKVEDCRDWEAIRAWSAGLLAVFFPNQLSSP